MKKTILSLSCALWLSIPAATAQVNLDSLEAVYDSLELGGVTVTAAKPMVKMEADKMTYDVSADDDAKSATVLDMLRKVPMVSVDGQDNITVNGSSAFKVYIDGKPNPMFSQNASQIFKMMPAAAVQKIEVITNPGAKYDAEGAVGVLNIVLAKQGGSGGGAAQSLNGLTGTVRAQVSNRSAGGGVFFSAKQGKLSASGNAFHQQQRLKDSEIADELTNSDGSFRNLNVEFTQRNSFTMGNLNLGYDLDSLNTLSASVGINHFRAKMGGNPLVTAGNALDGSTSYSYEHAVRSPYTSVNASADWQHFFSSERNHFLTLSYLLSHTSQKTEADIIYTSPLPSLFTQNRPKSLEQTLQFDYTRPIATGQTLNVGLKYIARSNKAWGEDRTEQASNVTEYRHSNDIGAAYAEYEGRFGVFSAKAGLRYEHTWQSVEFKQGAGEDFKSNYGNLVPSVSLSLSPSMTKNIGLTYNMRISRPGITYLNPHVDRSFPSHISYGNSNLEVEKRHNIGLTYSSFSQKFMFNVGLNQSFTNNQISEYSFVADGVVNQTYGNIVKLRNTALTSFVNWLATKNTRLILNGGLDYTDLRSSQLDTRNSGWHGNLMLGLQQTLPADFRLGLNAILNTKSYTLQGWQTGYELLVANVTKSFLEKRLNITLMGLTGLHKNGSLHIETHKQGSDYTQKNRIRVPIWQVQLSVSYTFGNMGVKTKEHKSRISNDFMEKKSEQEQIGNTGGM